MVAGFEMVDQLGRTHRRPVGLGIPSEVRERVDHARRGDAGIRTCIVEPTLASAAIVQTERLQHSRRGG